MTIIFKNLEQIRWFLLACLHYKLSSPLSPDKIHGFKEIVGKLLCLNKGRVSLQEVMNILPEKYHIGGSECTTDKLIPLILTLCQEAKKLPESLCCSFELIDEEMAVVTHIKAKNIWAVLRAKFPKPKLFFDWLKKYQPAETVNWIGAVESLDSACRELRMHPVDLLKKALPNWDGKHVVQEEVRIKEKGLPPLLANIIIPGIILLLKQEKMEID